MTSSNDMIIYTENPKELTKKFLELLSNYSKVEGHMANTQNPVNFLYSSSPQGAFEIGEGMC